MNSPWSRENSLRLPSNPFLLTPSRLTHQPTSCWYKFIYRPFSLTTERKISRANGRKDGDTVKISHPIWEEDVSHERVFTQNVTAKKGTVSSLLKYFATNKKLIRQKTEGNDTFFKWNVVEETKMKFFRLFTLKTYPNILTLRRFGKIVNKIIEYNRQLVTV